MKTSILKLRPHPVAKPWGLLHRPLKDITGVSMGVGELWLASAQTGEGNVASEVCAGAGAVDLAGLLERAERGSELQRWLGPVAAHALQSASFRGKTEAWLVREASGFAGFAAGPSCEKEKSQLEHILTGPGLKPDVRSWPEDVRRLFALVMPLKKGESFLVPAGTLHTMFAVGEGSRLVVDEIQQGYGSGRLPTLSKTLLVEDNLLSVQVHPDDETVRLSAAGELKVEQDLRSNPTVRVYDFGRRPGEDPELGFRLTDVHAGLRRVEQLRVDIEGCIIEFTVACPQFVMARLTLQEGAEVDALPVFGSYRILHCTAGRMEVLSEDSGCRLGAGETAFVPGVLEEGLVLRTPSGAEVIDQSVPDIAALKNWCCKQGVGGQEIERLLDPRRI